MAFIMFLVGSPLLFIAIASRRFGFSVIPTLVASVVGEISGFVLFSFYSKWKADAILAGWRQGAVVTFPAPSVSGRTTAWLTICAFGVLIGLIVLLVRYVYSRAQSA